MERCEHTWPATAEHIRDARASVTEFAAQLGAPPPALEDLRLAVSEAVGNVVLHGYRGRDAGNVTVVAEADDDQLTVVVSDEGCGMTARGDSPGAGLGLPLISEVTDSFSLAPGRGGRGTALCMSFALAAHQG